MNVVAKDWVAIGDLTDIPRQGARVVKTDAGCIAVFRTVNDEVYALDDRCPHKGGPLSNGIVHGSSVTCPLHNWVFDLATGLAQGADEGAVLTTPAKVESGKILLAVDALASRAAG
ncbi:nitrite reductase (NAD(P)H) small subunit [Roseibium polysiphoniae]|uniref:Nitrite reductase (NAD(P)H) small subunit n=1 Tax=Roseibium polysiphoniae TaxID=2571221 RepID=A0A944CEL1_9HYPH|nr:nitrite reductase small subunit NirD [Roseibium polysiphoniae]MBS8261035.1 nitrite reductase (NAD(P)H) small subunit [Roseibium polysiphoniae]